MIIVFWQTIVTPHMFPLASSLQEGGHEVVYIAEEKITIDRKIMGWEEPDRANVEVIIIKNREHIDNLISGFPVDAVHCVQGVYANGCMENVRYSLKKNGARWGAVMETIDERPWYWPLKRIVYRRYLSQWVARPDFILAIGIKTKDWIEARGYSPENTFSFTYFIDSHSNKELKLSLTNELFRIGFIGQLIPLKRLDLLIEALSLFIDEKFKLIVVGDGPLHDNLKCQAIEKLDNKFSLLGRMKMKRIPSIMKSLDCLVLPSDYDGWGVVVTEALMAGTPVICSDACGASDAVIASGVGGVFPKGDVVALRYLLKDMIHTGKQGLDKRGQLSNWAKCLGNKEGALYFSNIIDYIYNGGSRPSSPWSNNNNSDKGG